MKILLTGASSFTGFWFAKSLIKENNDVTAIFTKNSLNDYTGVRQKRIAQITGNVNSHFGVEFGDDTFLHLLDNENFDLICHHAAHVEDYKSIDFNYAAALHKNTFNIQRVLEILKRKSQKLILTGSVFEGSEGFGEDNSIAFSPYGLSKEFTAQAFIYFCRKLKVPLGKFVIPNPFGPYEDERLTTYLIKSWQKGDTPQIKTPLYIRDNIHISLLALAYVKFCTTFVKGDLIFSKINPSGYIESQQQFIKRFALEMANRLSLETPITFSEQLSFDEPIMRVNANNAALYVGNWDEEDAWDNLAAYYKQIAVQNE